ncbi:hypothetical protein O181_034713 [Austropuccinia psidii MF-1]|uniref:Uncharacterized protein n=1 Tax=Austropuccinia psidii MF-1 TaxID=1389203 RepID=A0A9Q3D617_9BASI|nr:hypothetical protein [Austropuccinia psidii MF-1]
MLVVGQFSPAQRSPFPGSTANVCDEIDGEEVEVVPNSIGHQSSTSPFKPASRRVQSKVIPSTPRSFQPVLSTIPPPSPSLSTSGPALVSPVRSLLIIQPRVSPMITSQPLKHVASSSRRRENCFTLPCPAAQLSKQRKRCPIQVGREDINMGNEGQDTVARFFKIVDRNIREVITYANDRLIPGTASEEMASKFTWYEDELIDDFQRTFDDLGRDN